MNFSLSQVLLLSAATTAAVSAQALPNDTGTLERALVPGRIVWITEAGGREERMRIVAVSGDVVTIAASDGTRTVRTTDVTRVRVRHTDRVLEGALIGAGVGVASGLFLCSLTEPWENCRDDGGAMVKIGALGAGIGISIDALIRGRTTIYESGRTSPPVTAAPIVSRHAAGLRVFVSF